MASIGDTTVVATELVSKPQTLAAPRYRYMKIFPTRGSSDLPIPIASHVGVQFEIPTQSFNYSKSYICGTLTVPSEANYSHWFYKDTVAWCNAATLRTRGGATLFDINYLNNYTKVVNRYETPLEDVITGDPTDIVYASRNSATADGIRPDNSAVNHLGVEAAYLTAGAVSAAAVFPFRIPLSKFVPNSMFSRKSDLKLPEIAILTLQLATGTKIAFEAKSETNPTTDVRAETKEIALSNFYMYLAKQDDPIYEAMFDERLRAGFTIPINYPMQSMIPLSSGRQNVSVTYNSGYGHRLVKIYHSVFHQTGSGNTAYDNDSSGVLKVNSYHVKIQGSRTSDDELKTADSSAYLHHKSLLEGTSVTNAEIYHKNFAHIEDVARIGGPKRWKELGFRKDDAEVGVPLTQDYKFEFVAETQNTNLHHFTFAILQRMLRVDATSVVVE